MMLEPFALQAVCTSSHHEKHFRFGPYFLRFLCTYVPTKSFAVLSRGRGISRKL